MNEGLKVLLQGTVKDLSFAICLRMIRGAYAEFSST